MNEVMAPSSSTFSSNPLDELPVRGGGNPSPFGGGANAGGAYAFGDSEAFDDRVPCSVCGRKFAADRIRKHQDACKKAKKPRKKFDVAAARMDAEALQLARHSGAGRGKRGARAGGARAASAGTKSSCLVLCCFGLFSGIPFSGGFFSGTTLDCVGESVSWCVLSWECLRWMILLNPCYCRGVGEIVNAGAGGGNEEALKPIPKWKVQREQLRAAMRAAKGYNEAMAAGMKPSDIPPPPPTYDDRIPCDYCGRKVYCGAPFPHVACLFSCAVVHFWVCVLRAVFRRKI